MNLNDAIRIMQEHNCWRRGERDDQAATTKEIGAAIDMLINAAIAALGLSPQEREVAPDVQADRL